MNQAKASPQEMQYTRVATSFAATAALMVSFYFLVTHGPTLIDAHALLFRFFETAEQAREAIAKFVIYFGFAMQVALAIACAHTSKKLKGSERVQHSGLMLLWVVHPVVVFWATLLMALACFTPTAFSGPNESNWPIFWMLVLAIVVFAFAFFCVVNSVDDDNFRNPMYALAAGKLLTVLCFAAFIPSMLTLTLLVGTYALDLLLRPVGEKIQATAIG